MLPQWPREVESVTLVFIFAFMWNCGLAHCKYSACCTLISGESCHSDNVRDLVQRQTSTMADKKTLVAYCSHKECWCCYRLKFYFASDWAFEASIFRLLASGGNHFLHGITLFKNGKPELISNNRKDLWNALIHGIQVQNHNVNLRHKQRIKWNGYCLTNDDIIQYMSTNMFEPALRATKNATTRQVWNDNKKQNNKRRKVANDNHVPMLYPTNQWVYCLATEIFHAFDGYVGHIFKYLLYLCHCSFEWDIEHTQNVMDELS